MIEPFYKDALITQYQGHILDVLPQMPAESVHCVVTSPPYWGLRDYGLEPQVWDSGGGLIKCGHEWGKEIQGKPETKHSEAVHKEGYKDAFRNSAKYVDHKLDSYPSQGQFCQKCNAWRGSLGLEPSPQLYIQHIVQVFREVWRVLRKDGVVWLNLGDSYATHASKRSGQFGKAIKEGFDDIYTRRKTPAKEMGLKEKDLCMIPARVALALQQPYIEPVCVKKEIDRSWLAAMFDGEGTIGIRRYDSYRKEKKQKYQDGFVVYTSVTNSDTALLDRCIEITGYGSARIKWGGQAGTMDKRGITTKRDSYGWRLDGNDAVDVIRAVYPYLIVKKKQAILGYTIDVLNKTGRKDHRGGKGGGARRVPSEIQEKKRFLYDAIKKCNQRESVDLPNWLVEPKQEVETGWYLRSAMPWVKRNSMPESVNGWRWERCRVKVKAQEKGKQKRRQAVGGRDGVDGVFLGGAEWTDCLGCPKCTPNDGLILKKSAGRPASALEYVFQLSKSETCFFDMDAVRVESLHEHSPKTRNSRPGIDVHGGNQGSGKPIPNPDGGRNFRNTDLFYESIKPPHGMIFAGEELVGLDVNPQSFKGSHFATFAEKLVMPLIKAGTSEKGCCPDCGANWVRVVEKSKPPKDVYTDTKKPENIRPISHPEMGKTVGMGQKLQNWYNENPSKTIGWKPSCKCRKHPDSSKYGDYCFEPNPSEFHYLNEPIPCTVLDPFSGSGRTLIVAKKLGRKGIGIDLKAEYLQMPKKELSQEVMEF